MVETGFHLIQGDHGASYLLGDSAIDTVMDGIYHIGFDIDMLDPVYAPGTGTPEIGGFTTFQAQQMLREMRGLHIVGGDVVAQDRFAADG
mgnify:CR=1 FL=1